MIQLDFLQKLKMYIFCWHLISSTSSALIIMVIFCHDHYLDHHRHCYLDHLLLFCKRWCEPLANLFWHGFAHLRWGLGWVSNGRSLGQERILRGIKWTVRLGWGWLLTTGWWCGTFLLRLTNSERSSSWLSLKQCKSDKILDIIQFSALGNLCY